MYIEHILGNDNNVMTNLLNMNSISQLKLWLCHVKLCKDVHRIKIDFIWSHFCLLSRVNDNHTDNAIEASWQRLLMLMRLDFNAFCLKEKRNISALNCFSYQIQGSFIFVLIRKQSWKHETLFLYQTKRTFHIPELTLFCWIVRTETKWM